MAEQAEAAPSVKNLNQEKVAAAVARIKVVCAKVGSHIQHEVPEAMKDTRWGIVTRSGEADVKRTPIKFVLETDYYIGQKLRYVPYFQGVKSALDVGTGPAHLFMLLRDILGINMHGIDVTGGLGEYLYRALWEEFGVADKMVYHKVTVGQDMPIPNGVDSVIVFGPTFDATWDIREYAWFVDMLNAKKIKRLFWRFNMRPNLGHIVEKFKMMGAQFPRPADDTFFVLDLNVGKA